MGFDHAVATRVVVRVLGDAGEPVGAGFLLGPDLVATCAHVVAEALAQWTDRLCGLLDRPFADGERALLPATIDVDRPCA